MEKFFTTLNEWQTHSTANLKLLDIWLHGEEP